MPALLRSFFILFIVQAISGQDYDKNVANDIYPWCIVAYDSLQRTYEDRIGMLKDLGFKKYAYDWRDKHLSETEEELRLAIDSDIEIVGLWLWLDAKRDTVGQLSESNETLFKIVEKIGLKSTFWVGLSPNFFLHLSDEESLQKAVAIIDFVTQKASAIGCRVALYNHSGWFAEPFNQLRIIKALPQHKLQVVFNFHHAHKHIQKLPDIAKALAPYLCAVNLNGMEISGSKILPIGRGRYEKQMVTTFTNMGFDGPWGIMGHVENEDVKVVLQKNLIGFTALFEVD